MNKRIKLTDETLVSRIHLVRGVKVMLDRDLAQLYNVATRDLNKAVLRNYRRFPPDFMFRLKPAEAKNLMFQFGTSRWGGTRKLPYAFTEQGIAMLSSVLRSERAIQVNIHIIRVFTRLRQFMLDHKDILLQLERLEKKVGKHDEQIQAIFEYMKEMFSPSRQPMRKIGFRQRGREMLLLK
ncbi:MAG: ORF6N domain-containing protein [Cyclobacteriaceae bacterium]|nr:ORF6N domain-containing protein [Cyclobacteriaceae bacterium]